MKDIEELIRELKETKKSIENISKLTEEVKKINKNTENILDFIVKSLSETRFDSYIKLMSLYLQILPSGVALGYIHSGQVPLTTTISPGEKKTYVFTFPEGYASVIPNVEMDASTSDTYLTISFNSKEYFEKREVKVEVPWYFIDVSTPVDNYKIPVIRITKYLPFIPVWYVKYTIENRGNEDSKVYITFTYLMYEEKMLVNIYFNILDKIYDVLEKIALERTDLFKLVEKNFK